MTWKVMSGLAALALAGATMAGCTSDRVPGCVPPSNEAGLLDEFMKEPVLAVAPEGSKRREEPKRVEACHRFGDKNATETVVAVHYDVPRSLAPGEVRSLYEPAATKSGWTPVPVEVSQLLLRYCRDVHGQPGLLEVTWQEAIERQRVPAVVSILLRPADPTVFEGAAQAEAARKGKCR
jgi:hypothetical protein